MIEHARHRLGGVRPGREHSVLVHEDLEVVPLIAVAQLEEVFGLADFAQPRARAVRQLSERGVAGAIEIEVQRGPRGLVGHDLEGDDVLARVAMGQDRDGRHDTRRPPPCYARSRTI